MTVTVLRPRPGVTRIVATLPHRALYHWRKRRSAWTLCGKRAILPSVFVTDREHEVSCDGCLSKLKKVETP